MAQGPRMVPEGGALVEITSRTLQGRLLLRPDDAVNATIVGTLARAAKRQPDIKVCGVVVLSNHYHLLLWVPDALAMAEFMEYFNGKLGREISRLTGWGAKVWSRRYTAIVISDEEAAQMARMRYLLSHGCKENLVYRVHHWPGVHCGKPLSTGSTRLTGIWQDRTAESRARDAGKLLSENRFRQVEELRLQPLPCWAHLPMAAWQKLIREMVEEVEEEAARERLREGKGVLGPKRIRAQSPLEPICQAERRPVPDFHAASREHRSRLRRAYALFLAAYRLASARLRAGERRVQFPSGCFPPAMPFVAPPRYEAAAA